MSEKRKNDEIVEEITIKGQELVEYVKELIQKGNVRRIIIRKSNGDEIMQVPLTAAVVGAGALAVFATPLVAIGAIAAYLAEVKIDIVRVADGTEETPSERKNKVDIE
jgi:hypothetical protein